jgi:DNA-directed RNA polymerase subunit alpha
MSSSAATPDLSTFLSRLSSFDRDDLASVKTLIRTSPAARREAEEALKQTDGKNGIERASLLYMLCQPQEAIEALGDDSSAQGGLLRGLFALETGDPTTAAAAFGSLVGTSMEGPTMLADLATAAALSGDTAMAKNAAAKLPEGADSAYAEGIAFESDGEYEEARNKYEHALKARADHPRALFRLALRHDMEGNDNRAIELYQRLAAAKPTHVNGLINLGLLYEDHGRYTEAEQCYRRVLAADPGHVRARVGLKDVRASLNMYYDEDHERREDRRNQILRTPITEFELSVRSRNCLAKMHIESLGDLVKKSEAELLAYKNFGETSLQEIKDILAQKGLRLGMSQDDDAPLYTRQHADDDAVNALFGAPAAPPVATGTPAPAAPSAASGDASVMPIEKLDLSIRARRCMDNLDIRTIADLLQRSETELLASKNFGQTSLNEVRRKLEGLGLSLRRK